MQIVVILMGLVCGWLGAVAWLAISRRSETKSLFDALGKSIRALLSDDGQFLRAYGALLVCVGIWLFWNILALAAAVAPLALVCWLFQRPLEGHLMLFIIVYSVGSMASIIWLGRRAKPGVAERGGLSVSDSQFFFLQLVENAPWLMRKGATLENRWLRSKLAGITIDRPIFVTGLARSGTTMLLELLSQSPDLASHRYSDFPFLMTPYFWNWFVRLFGAKKAAVERPHQDGIQITLESPDAFEEPLWQQYFLDTHRVVASHRLDPSHHNPEFDHIFANQLRKILLIRKGRRYLSKGNYNVTRLEYLSSLFPDALFVVPIRHPIDQVTSLARQHELFCEYSQHDPRVPHYMEAAGHYEFGPQRVPISVAGSGQQSVAAWAAGDEQRGYAIQWAAVYGYIFELLERCPAIAARTFVVRYEDICADPSTEMKKVLAHVQLDDPAGRILGSLGHIKRASARARERNAANNVVWDVTQAVATKFGYQFD